MHDHPGGEGAPKSPLEKSATELGVFRGTEEGIVRPLYLLEKKGKKKKKEGRMPVLSDTEKEERALSSISPLQGGEKKKKNERTWGLKGQTGREGWTVMFFPFYPARGKEGHFKRRARGKVHPLAPRKPFLVSLRKGRECPKKGACTTFLFCPFKGGRQGRHQLSTVGRRGGEKGGGNNSTISSTRGEEGRAISISGSPCGENSRFSGRGTSTEKAEPFLWGRKKGGRRWIAWISTINSFGEKEGGDGGLVYTKL